MSITRRFIFRGNASAINGRLIRPADIVLENGCASALPVVGGRSVSRTGPLSFGNEIQLESASTLAEGVFDDASQYEKLTYRQVSEETLTATTRVSADVRGLVVGAKPRLRASHITAAMRSRSPGGSGETPVSIEDDTTIEGLDVDGHRLIVELDTGFYRRHDTKARLLAAVEDPMFVRENGDLLHMRAERPGRVVPPGGQVIRGEYLHATIVRTVRWDGEPYPGSSIEHNVVSVPNFGRIYLGELLITTSSKRLTMVRLELGSPAGGSIACAGIEDNGGWST
jgi:hypothetical protein